ncbi:hypothetical protein ACJX0J_018032 [Zea mays]
MKYFAIYIVKSYAMYFYQGIEKYVRFSLVFLYTQGYSNVTKTLVFNAKNNLREVTHTSLDFWAWLGENDTTTSYHEINLMILFVGAMFTLFVTYSSLASVIPLDVFSATSYGLQTIALLLISLLALSHLQFQMIYTIITFHFLDYLFPSTRQPAVRNKEQKHQ